MGFRQLAKIRVKQIVDNRSPASTGVTELIPYSAASTPDTSQQEEPLSRETDLRDFLVPRYRDGSYMGSVEVGLKFFDIEKLRLENFNHQNVVSTLTFEELSEKSEYSTAEVKAALIGLFFGDRLGHFIALAASATASAKPKGIELPRQWSGG